MQLWPKRVAGLLVILMTGGTAIGASFDWPPLPTRGFVSGRPAQREDIAKGDAVFVTIDKDVPIGKPLPILIPQYALLIKTGERVILVRAEETNGIRLLGVRKLDGKEAVVGEKDLELLGTQPPAR